MDVKLALLAPLTLSLCLSGACKNDNNNKNGEPVSSLTGVSFQTQCEAVGTSSSRRDRYIFKTANSGERKSDNYASSADCAGSFSTSAPVSFTYSESPNEPITIDSAPATGLRIDIEVEGDSVRFYYVPPSEAGPDDSTPSQIYVSEGEGDDATDFASDEALNLSPCEDSSGGIAACAEGSFPYFFANKFFVIKAYTWEAQDSNGEAPTGSWNYNGLWVEREEHSRSGVSFSLLIGRSELADHFALSYELMPSRGKHFALAVLFRNGARYVCLPTPKDGDTVSQAKDRFLGLGDDVFNPDDPNGRSSCPDGYGSYSFNNPWKAY